MIRWFGVLVVGGAPGWQEQLAGSSRSSWGEGGPGAQFLHGSLLCEFEQIFYNWLG